MKTFHSGSYLPLFSFAKNISSIDKTTTWCYDIGGNIVSRTEYDYTTGDLTDIVPTATFAYTYGSNWKDQLVSFNGQSIDECIKEWLTNRFGE